MREILALRPEVETVVSQLGRPDDGTDVAGFYNLEFFVPLKPAEEWRKGLTKAKLTDDLNKKLANEFPGVVFNFSQNIEDNVEEALSGREGREHRQGRRAETSRTTRTIGRKILNEPVTRCAASRTSGCSRRLGQPNVNIVPDRALCARYGLNVGDVDAVVQAAVGGQAVTQVFEGEKRFDLVGPLAGALPRQRRAHQGDPDRDAGRHAASRWARSPRSTQENGPALIYREANQRYVPVKFSVRNRDLAGTIAEAQEKIHKEIPEVFGTHLEWAGEINQLREAVKRLYVIIPLTLLLIALLVYASVRNWRDMLLVLCNIPIGCIGGILALLISRHQLQHLGGDGLHLDLRHRHPGRPAGGELRAAALAGRPGTLAGGILAGQRSAGSARCS